MKKYIFLFCLFALISCASEDKYVYWCGDHPCKNKKERKNYFEENMTVELRKVSKSKNNVDATELEKIIEKARKKEKKNTKQNKKILKQTQVNDKQKLKEEKRLQKIADKEAKKRIKEEEKRIKKEKKLAKKNKNKKIEKKIEKNTLSINVSDIQKIADSIAEKNKNKPYPQINSVPN